MQKIKAQTFRKFFKDLLLPFLVWLALATTILGIFIPAYAQTPGSYLTDPKQVIPLPSYQTNAHSNASYEQGASNITSAILYVVDFVKYLMGTIAVIVIIISGLRLITSARQVDEVANKQKENLKYAIIGLIIIIAGDQFIKTVFYGEHGEVYSSGATLQDAAKKGSEQIKAIYNMIEYVAAALAILMIVIGGVRLVASGGNEEVQGKVKKQIMYAVLGLILLGVAEFVVKDIIFPKEGTVLSDTEKAKHFIVNFTNFISGFIATLAAIMFIYGGYLYVTAFGNEDGTGKAKKVITEAVIGLLLAMGAFALVNTLVKFEPTSTVQSAGTNAPANLPTNGNIPASP